MIGEALAAATTDREVLARIGGPLGEIARAASARLATLDATSATARRATWAAAARTPAPPGIRGIDASWIEAALAALPGRTRRSLADTPATAVDVWLARWACAALPPMPPVEPALARPREAGEALRLPANQLRAWLDDVGADQLAFALGAQTAGALGPHVVAAAARITQAPRAGELGERRAALARAKIEIDDRALARVGARTIAPHLDDLARLQLAHRLPRSLGLLAELRSFAGSPLAGAPTWRALAAP